MCSGVSIGYGSSCSGRGYRRPSIRGHMRTGIGTLDRGHLLGGRAVEGRGREGERGRRGGERGEGRGERGRGGEEGREGEKGEKGRGGEGGREGRKGREGGRD